MTDETVRSVLNQPWFCLKEIYFQNVCMSFEPENFLGSLSSTIIWVIYISLKKIKIAKFEFLKIMLRCYAINQDPDTLYRQPIQILILYSALHVVLARYIVFCWSIPPDM